MKDDIETALLKILINTIIFFENSNLETLDDDVAVQQIEDIAVILNDLNDLDKKYLKEKISNISKLYDDELKKLIISIPELLGISD